MQRREVEDKEMTSELPNITVSEGPKEEKKRIESWLSQPPEIIEFFGKTETEEVGNDDEVANMNVINKGSVETVEGDVFSKSLSVADEESVRYTEHSQVTSEGEKSKSLADSVGKEMDPEIIRPTIDMADVKNKHGSSLLDAPVEKTTSEKAGTVVGECVEESMSMSHKEASQETVELAEEMKDSTSVEDELPHKNPESSFFKKVGDFFFHKVDNLETSAKESESGMKESQHEAEHKSEILENIATADSDQSRTGMHDEIQDTKADVSFGRQRESTEREGEDHNPTDNVVGEEQEKTETSTHEEQSGQHHMQKTEGEAPMDSEEIETEGSSKYAETITNIEEQRPVGSPEEINGEKPKDETISADDISKNEVQEANDLPTIDLDEKTRSAELEIPNKNGSELWNAHPPVKEEVQVECKKQDEVSMSESGDPPEAIQFPNKEEKHVNEISEATESVESTISEPTATEGELNVEATSTSKIDSNTEKGCELKSEEALKEINAEDNVEEEREQTEDEVPHKNLESSFFEKIKGVFFHKVDNLETSVKESEPGMKDFVKESQHEAEHEKEILENIAAADSDQSTTGMQDQIQDTEADVSFGQQRESAEGEREDVTPTDNFVVVEKEKTETSTQEEQSGQRHLQSTEREAPTDSKEIETEGSDKYAETITNIEEQRPVGSPDEVVGEKPKDETIIADDINKNEVQEANNLPTVDLDEKTRSAELEIPNKSGSELWNAHPPVEEEVQVECKKQDEVSMSESGDTPEAIQFPNKEEKHVNEISEATESLESTISETTATEGELSVEATSTREIDSNTEKGCELKSEEALKEINAEDNVVGEEQEKTETLTHEEQSGQHHMQKTEGEAPMDSEEIETEGSSKYAETITNIEDQGPVGSPEEIDGEKPKDETISADDISKNEVQEANDLPTIDLDEKTRSAELEIPNKNGSELWNAHPPVKEEVQVECKKQDEVYMSESGDTPEAIQFPNKEEKHVNEISEATESLESTISETTATEGELSVEATSTREIDSNTEKGCELKSEEALKEINAEDNVEEEREQTEDDVPHKNLESSFFEKIKGVFFHKVDNLETSAKESEPGMKDFVTEGQHEAEHEKEILENIAAADGDQSTTGMHDEIQDTKADVSFGQQRESAERGREDLTPTDKIVAEEQEKTETSTQEEQSGQRYLQSTERETPTDSKEIETEGFDKYAETITNIEEQTPVGSPDEVVGEKPKDETIIADDINKNEVQEANNLPTVDLDEKTRSAELEIPNKSGSELWITHPPVEEEVKADREKQNEVSMSESGDPQEAIQFPSKEEKHVNETFESPESTISEHTAAEGELNIEETSTREMDINSTEKGCELKSEETVNEIDAEDNTEEEREQIEKASETEFSVERKSGEDGRSTIEEDIPVKKGTPLCSGEEDYHHDQEEQVRSSNSFPEELTERVSGDQSYITSDETKTIDEQIIYQEVCEDPKLADRAEDIKKEMENEENTITDFSPEPTGERPTKSSEGNETDAKKHEAEAYGESTTMEENAITDLPSSDVREDKVEESLKEDRREAMIPDKEVWNSNIESRERDSEATHSTAESTAMDLKDEAEANEGLNAQSTIGSSSEETAQESEPEIIEKEVNKELLEKEDSKDAVEAEETRLTEVESSEETAQESDSNLVQSSSAPEIIEKEVNKELLEKEDLKDAVAAEETRFTEAESEYPMGVDSSNLISEEKGQATAETSEMRSNDIEIMAESEEISGLHDNEDMEISTARRDGADESTEKTQPEGKNETCDELSKPEDQREISTVEASSEYMPEQEHLESSTVPLEAHNLVTGESETPGEALEKEKTSSDKEETALVAETTEEYIAETEGDSTIQGNDTNMGSIDIGKESTIDDALVRELHAPLELNDVKSISESDVELLKGVNPSEADDGSNISKLETPDDEKSSKVGVETGKSEYEEAVDEASHGIEVGGESIETEKTILEQEGSAKNFEGSPKEGVEMEKPTVEFESEAYSCGSDASETQTISTQTEKKIDVEDKESASELPNVTVNEVPLQEKENTESWLSQPPGSIEIPETECVQVTHDDVVGNVNVVNNVGTTEGESFLKSTSVADGELNENTEDDQLNTKEEMSGFQEEEGKAKMITDKNVMAEASYGQDEGVIIQTPEVMGSSSRDIEMLNEVPHEGNMESITSTETTSIEQDLKETSFEGEDKKSNALEMDPEATQPSTDVGEEKNEGEEMPHYGVKDDYISTETATEDKIDEPTESNVVVTDKLGSLLVTEPDVCKSLEENSSMACEDEIQETSKLVERVKEDASIEDEVEKQNLESSFVKKAENIETSKEESETVMKDIDKETQNEAESQNNTLENAATAGSNLSTEGENVENQETKSYVAAMKPEDSVTRESEDITPAEDLTMEREPRVTVVPGEDNVVVEEQEATETSKHEEHSEQILKQNTEPAKANPGSSSVVASEEFETTSLNDYPESISKIEDERPVGSPEEILGETIISADTNEDGTTEAKNLSTDDAGEKTRSAEFNIPNDNVNEVHVTTRPVEEPEEDEKNRNEISMLESEEQDRNETETAQENLGSPSIVALEEFETTSHDEYTESITKNEEERPVGNPEEIIGEQRSDEIMIADDSNNEEIPEAESLSAVDSYEKTRSAEIKIPDNNTRGVCVTHPPVEETVLEGGEKQNEVSLSESVDQVHEASASEVPEDEEKHANDSCEASKSPDCNISEHTCTEGELNTEATTTAKEIPAGSQEEILWQPIKDESMIKIPEEENPSTVDSYVTPPSMEETFLDGGENKNDVSVLDQVHEASEVPREEEKEKEKESKGTYEAIESPESNILENTSTEGAVDMEATSTRSAVDITLDTGCEPVSEDELKELKAEENLKEEIEQKEKTADAEFQIPTIIHQDPKIADSGEDTEDLMKNEAHTVADLSPEPTGEHTILCPQENETEVLDKLPTAKGSANMGIQMKEEHSTTKDNFDESYGEETRNECSYDEEKEEKEPDTAASNVYGTAPVSTTTEPEECSISDLPSSLIKEEKVEEKLKEDREDETKSEIEVSNSHAEAFDAVYSTEQREDLALKHEAEANEDVNAESITESSSEETTQKERNVDLVENSSSVPEICEKEIKEEVLEKEYSNVPVVAEETSSTQVEGENVQGLDSADPAFEEKGQVSTETSQMGSNATDLIDRSVETSILGENNKTEIPTAREVATVETSLDDISEQTFRASSIQTSKEHDLMSPEVETTGEAPEKDETLYEKAETSLAEETTEDEIREIEDASSNPVKDTDLGSIDKEKERANAYAAVEDREFCTPPEQNIEESTSESDAEVLRRVTTSEVADRNEISKSEAVEELKSSEKDKPEYDTAISETSEGVETCGGYMDTEKAIPEQEDSAKNLEGSSKENDEIEKVPVESKAETHGSETSEATSISTLKEENINIVEHDETAAESMVKDEDNRRFPETNPTNTEEESHDDENQAISSTDEQISRQDIEEGKKEMNEVMETKLETQEEINGTQDAILTEKVSTEIESASERETIKEQNMEEESCTKELHMLPAADNERIYIYTELIFAKQVPTVIESASESEIIKEQIMEEESCTEELHKITAADETVNDVRETDLAPIQSLEATASNKNAEMMGSNIADDLNMESEATEKEVNKTEDAFSTEEVSAETSSAMDEVTYPDLTAVHSLEATASNEITEMMESKSAQDLNEESETSPMADVLEDETKNIEKPVDVSSLASEGSDEKMKGEKIDDMEICHDETDTASTVATDLPSLGEVQPNDEPVKALDTSSHAESLQTTKTADAGEEELEETSIIASQFSIQEHENGDNANIHVEKSDVEVEAPEIPDSVSQTEDQEIHETGTSLNVIDGGTKEIVNQIREVPEGLLEPTNQHADAARDDEITPGQTPQAEKTEDQLQVPSSGLLSEEQESETTTGIGKGSTDEDAMEEAKMRQAEVSMIREELETTSEGEGIENQVQGEENRVRDLSTVSSAEELDAESSKDISVITMSAQEVLETNHGGQDTDEPVKALVTSSDTGSLQATETSDASQQELDETSRVVSQLPVDECEKSENISAKVDQSDTNNVEENELEIPGAVPEHTDQRVQEIQETGTSLPVGESHTSEIAYQTREVPEAFSKAIKQDVEAVSGDEIIAPAGGTKETSLGEIQLNEHVEALDTHSSAENIDTIKTADASQHDAEFENMKLEETCIMVSQPPIHEHEEADRENIPLEKSEDNYAQVEETEIPDTEPESEHQAVKVIHETGTSLNVGDTDTNEIEKPISEVPEALLETMNQGVDAARNDEITSSQIVQGEKLEEQLEAPSSGLLSKELESETTTTDKKGSTDRDDIEGTKMLQAEIREEIKTTSEGKGFVNQVQAEEKRAQDWSTVPNAEELDTESSTDNAIITKMSTEETTQTPDASQQELEETSSMVSQLPVDIYEKPDNESVTEEKSDAYDVEVKEIDLPGVVPESSDQRVKEIHEVGTSVEETRTEEVETQTREVCEALPEDVNQGGEKVSGDEIIAPSEATKVTSLGELQLNDEHVEAPDTVKTGDGSQQDAEFESMKCEETSIMVSQLPTHEHEKEESANIPVEKSDAKVVVEEAEIPGTVPESEDQAVKEIHETGTSLTAGGADKNETEKQIRGVPEALSEPMNPCFDTSSNDEMTPVETPRAEKIEEDLQVPSSALLSKEVDGETSIAIEKGSTDKDVTEVGSLELQENSGSVFQLPVTEFRSANDVIEEKSEVDEVELNETKALDAVSDSKDRGFEAIHEIETIPAAEDTETDKLADEIKEVTEKIPDPRYKGVDAATDGENLDHPLPVGKLEEQIQLSSSSYEGTKEEAAELDKSGLEKFKDLSSKLPTTEHVGTTIETSEADEVLVEEAKTSEAISESKGDGFEEFKEIGSSPPVEKIHTDADEVELNETKTLDAVSESKDPVFEEIREIRTIPATEDTETEKVENETKEVTEKIPDLRYKGADAATDGENLGHPLSVGKLEEKIQLSSSSYESTKEDATELDKSELEEATDMLSKLPTTEHGIRHVGTTIEDSEADEVQVEEAKTSEAISESKGDGFEEFKEFGSSPPVEKTRTDEVQEETKAVPETIFEPTYQGAQTAVDVETAINQTLTPQGVEQLHEPKSTTEKPCLQDEGQRELEVSNLELKLQKDSQDISPDEENKGLEKRSTDAPSQYEERPVQQSLQEASTDEDIVYSKNSNKDADNLPTPYPTVTEHSTEDIGGKYEEVSNLEFEKNGEVLLESVSAINSPSVPLTSEGIEVIKETPKENTTELGDRENNCEETIEEEAIEKHTSTEKNPEQISEEMQGSRNFDQISLQEETATKTNQEDELRAEDYPGERTNTIFDASRNEIQPEMVFKESEEDCVDNNMVGVIRADDKGPHQVSASDEIANQSELESHGDETAFTDTATEATARIEELKSSEAMLVSHEVERAGDIDEETEISKDGQLQNKDLVVPPVADTAAEEALDGKELETLDDFSERDLDTNHGRIEPYEHKKEIATAGTVDSESLVDNEKLGHTFPELGCDGNGGTEDLDLTKKDGSNEPSISSTTATSQETLTDEETEKAVDTKQHHFMSDKPTAEPESIPEEGNGFQLEAHTMDKVSTTSLAIIMSTNGAQNPEFGNSSFLQEPVVSVMADEAKLDENKIRTTTAIEEESPQENEKPNVLPHIMDSETEVSREAVTMNISDDIQGPEKTSLAIPHEQIASKTDPSESIERTNSKGMECGEENRMGKQSKEITEESQMIESAKMSLSDLLQRSAKRNVQVGEDVTEERELMGNKEEPQNETAETVEAEEEEAVHDKKDEEEEGDELKREDSGSDAPVMVEASRDMDVKIAHKKPHHHNILSGVGSKVKHSLAKVKKAITGKSSHPKPTSPK
ncbi:hypothetical protein RHGRI_022849 [Rhododendron griersonianum]|uniref:Titin-like n=1 Tax=Rhododendron griersonianum TaxID=479676 RepID=A0AAV6J881_9ERIC|nr:hypothetical protein RHGRI_022849 [Rhododendron griersonianum]